ncbi:site-specific tyrosine recombinase XerC [compost metagenome]
MRSISVSDVKWAGTDIISYALLSDGPLQNDSLHPFGTAYLLHIATSTKKLKTAQATAEDLKPFFQTLKNHDQEWDKLSSDDISGYLNKRLSEGLSEASLDRTISSLKGLYRFGWEAGYLSAPKCFSYNYKSPHIPLTNSRSKKRPDLHIKYINSHHFNLIASSVIGKTPFIRERNELALHLGYRCGLRAEEVTDRRNLDTAYLSKIIKSAEANGKLTATINIIGKRDKLRKVDIPPAATQKIKNFMENHRNEIPPGPLICSTDGKPLVSKFASTTFRLAKEACSWSANEITNKLLSEQIGIHLLSKSSWSNLSFHCLRHTYATNLVDFCYKHGIDPWTYLPQQMGHSDTNTTKDYIIFDALIYGRIKILKALEYEQL